METSFKVECFREQRQHSPRPVQGWQWLHVHIGFSIVRERIATVSELPERLGHSTSTFGQGHPNEHLQAAFLGIHMPRSTLYL